MSFDPKTENAAQNFYGEMTREDYDRFMSDYQPIEDARSDTIGDPNRLSRRLTDATAAANTSFDSSEDMLKRNASRYGQDMTGDAGALAKRKLGMQRALAIVDGRNGTRQNVKDRDYTMLTRKVMEGQRYRANASATGGAATSAELRENERQRTKANNSLSSALSTVGAVTGFM